MRIHSGMMGIKVPGIGYWHYYGAPQVNTAPTGPPIPYDPAHPQDSTVTTMRPGFAGLGATVSITGPYGNTITANQVITAVPGGYQRTVYWVGPAGRGATHNATWVKVGNGSWQVQESFGPNYHEPIYPPYMQGVAGLSDFVPAMYSVPQIPILDESGYGMSGLGAMISFTGPNGQTITGNVTGTLQNHTGTWTGPGGQSVVRNVAYSQGGAAPAGGVPLSLAVNGQTFTDVYGHTPGGGNVQYFTGPGGQSLTRNVSYGSGAAGVQGLSDFVNAAFALPENPIMNAGMGGCGCGCDGGCGGGMQGISEDFTAMWNSVTAGDFSGAGTAFMALMTEPVFGGVPLWGVVGAGIVAFMLFGAGKSSRSRWRRPRVSYS